MLYEELLEIDDRQPRRRGKDRRRPERARLDWRDLAYYEELADYLPKRDRRGRALMEDERLDDRRPRRRDAKPWRRRGDREDS